jgi:hypothetical protein
MTIVVDVTRKEVCLSSSHIEILSSCVIPGAPALVDKLETILPNRSYPNDDKSMMKTRNSLIGSESNNAHHHRHIVYLPSPGQLTDAENVRIALNSHISALIAMAKEFSYKSRLVAKDLGPSSSSETAAATISLSPIQRTAEDDTRSPMLYFFTSDDDDDNEEEDEAEISGDTIEFVENRKNQNLQLLRQFYSNQAAVSDKDDEAGKEVDKDSPKALTATPSVKATLTDQFLSSIRQAAPSSLPLPPLPTTSQVTNSSTSMSGLLNSFIGSSKDVKETIAMQRSRNLSNASNSTTTGAIGKAASDNSPSNLYPNTNAMVTVSGSTILCLSKLDDFHGDNEKFFERFIATQVSCYCHYYPCSALAADGCGCRCIANMSMDRRMRKLKLKQRKHQYRVASKRHQNPRGKKIVSVDYPCLH